MSSSRIPAKSATPSTSTGTTRTSSSTATAASATSKRTPLTGTSTATAATNGAPKSLKPISSSQNLLETTGKSALKPAIPSATIKGSSTSASKTSLTAKSTVTSPDEKKKISSSMGSMINLTPTKTPISILSDDEQSIVEHSGYEENSDLISELHATIEEMSVKDQESTATIKNLNGRISSLESQLLQKSKEHLLSPSKESAGDNEEIQELQQQILEYMDNLEMAQLDKDQLTIENEILEEKLNALQMEFAQFKIQMPTGEAMHSSSSSSDASAVSAENAKLREALRKLKDESVVDKESLAWHKKTLEASEVELMELKSFKEKILEEMKDLREQVDASSSFEAMLEKLTEQNQRLQIAAIENKQTISDLEDAVELNEEIDAQQRKQIESDRYIIDELNRVVIEYEKKVSEKESALVESRKLVDKLHQMNKTFKKEVADLQQILSTESQETSSLQSKARETANLKAKIEMLENEIRLAHKKYTACSTGKSRYQSMYTRMENMFGASGPFEDELKHLSVEMTLVSAIGAGAEAMKAVSSIINQTTDRLPSQDKEQPGDEGTGASIPLEDEDSSWSRIDPVEISSLFGKLYLLQLQSQSFIMQCNCVLFSEPNSGMMSNSSAMSNILRLKGLNESVCQLIDQFEEAKRKDDVERMKEIVLDVENLIEEFVEVITISTKFEDNRRIDSKHCLTTLAILDVNNLLYAMTSTSLNPTTSRSTDDVSEMSSPRKESSGRNVGVGKIALQYLSPSIQFEMLLLSINTLCDLTEHHLEYYQHNRPMSSGSDGGDVDNHTKNIRDVIKTIKIDIRSSLFQVKNSKVVDMKGPLEQLRVNYGHFMELFEQSEKYLIFPASNMDLMKCEEMLKDITAGVHKALAVFGTSSNRIVIDKAQSVHDVLHFFPFVGLTRPTSNTSNLEEEIAIRDQFFLYMDKLWNLLTVGTSDFVPFSIGGGMLNSDGGVNSDINLQAIANPGVAEAAWKLRVADVKNMITTKLSDQHQRTNRLKMDGFYSKEQYNAIVCELDVKKDELKLAIRNTIELQQQLNIALAANGNFSMKERRSSINQKPSNAIPFKSASLDTPGTSTMHSEEALLPSQTSEILQLRNEIEVLEAALEAAENRVETLDKETKTLKAQLSSQLDSAFSPVDINSAGPFSPVGSNSPMDGMNRNASKKSVSLLRRSGWDLTTSANTAANSSEHGLQQGIPPKSQPPSHHTTSNHGNVLLQTQLIFWKRLAMKKFIHSLKPIPDPNQMKRSQAQQLGRFVSPQQAIATGAVATLQSISAAGGNHGEDLVIKDSESQSKVIELVGSFESDGTLTPDYRALYHDVRRCRVNNLRIKTISDSNNHNLSKKGLPTRPQIIFRMPLQ